MSLTEVEITGFRSIRTIRLPLRRLTVLVGSNGVGKTNLYRSLELLHAAATGTLAEEIAREGGLASVHFAGELRRQDKPQMALMARLDDVLDGESEVEYRCTLGFPMPTAASFPTEAQVKTESLTARIGRKPTVLMERNGPAVWARDGEGKRAQAEAELLASETALSSLRGGYRAIDAVRHVIASWRFYHGFRTDPDSPLRKTAPAITSPMLSADGSNLAAVFATIRHIRADTVDLDEAVEHAFPGARLWVPTPENKATFGMSFPDLPKRQFGAHELSDGTLQYLALMGALLAYRLPPFIALNEPETSLHPSLLPALGRIIAKAAERTQIWVVTHSQVLADAIAEESGVIPRTVIRRDGATWLEGLTNFGTFEDE